MSRVCHQQRTVQIVSIVVNTLFGLLLFYAIHLHFNRKWKPGFLFIRSAAIVSVFSKLLVSVLYYADARPRVRMVAYVASTFWVTCTTLCMFMQWAKYVAEALYRTKCLSFGNAAPRWLGHATRAAQLLVSIVVFALVVLVGAEFKAHLNPASDALMVFALIMYVGCSLSLFSVHLRVYRSAAALSPRTLHVRRWLKKTRRMMAGLVVVSLTFFAVFSSQYLRPAAERAECQVLAMIGFDVMTNVGLANLLWHTDVASGFRSASTGRRRRGATVALAVVQKLRVHSPFRNARNVDPNTDGAVLKILPHLQQLQHARLHGQMHKSNQHAAPGSVEPSRQSVDAPSMCPSSLRVGTVTDRDHRSSTSSAVSAEAKNISAGPKSADKADLDV